MRGSNQGRAAPGAAIAALAAACALVLLTTGCSGSRLADPLDVGGTLPVSGSASDDVGASALPPPVVRRTTAAARAAAPNPFVRTADEGVPPSWSTPAPVGAPTPSGYPYAAPAAGTPMPPPPPNIAGGQAAPVVRYVAPTTDYNTYAAAPAAAVPLSQRCWTGCGLPCESGISSWHARLVGGWPLYEGTDTPESCSYWGVDLGRTHCGCWGYDLYYRMSGAKFDREGYPDGITRDGGLTHHVGGKLTWERSIANSKFYFWTGLGAGYYFTSDYVEDSDGFEVFGELGLGYVFNETFRLRAGLNVHGADTDTGRKNFADVGKGRWLWLLAPVAELEVNF
jgi:hypothetical protein